MTCQLVVVWAFNPSLEFRDPLARARQWALFCFVLFCFQNKTKIRGWGNGSKGEVFVTQAWGLEFRFPEVRHSCQSVTLGILTANVNILHFDWVVVSMLKHSLFSTSRSRTISPEERERDREWVSFLWSSNTSSPGTQDVLKGHPFNSKGSGTPWNPPDRLGPLFSKYISCEDCWEALSDKLSCLKQTFSNLLSCLQVVQRASSLQLLWHGELSWCRCLSSHLWSCGNPSPILLSVTPIKLIPSPSWTLVVSDLLLVPYLGWVHTCYIFPENGFPHSISTHTK